MPLLQHRTRTAKASPTEAARAVARSAAETVRLLASRRLAQPRPLVGGRLVFADGTASTVFRETAVVGLEPHDPAILVVKFRLRWIGLRPWAHAVFRRTCVVNTPLFAGFPGFATKLWLHDRDTGVYRGFYEWDGADRAAWYAERLRYVLLLVCVSDSIAYHVVPGPRRTEVLAHPELLRDGTREGEPAETPGPWWRFVASVR